MFEFEEMLLQHVCFGSVGTECLDLRAKQDAFASGRWSGGARIVIGGASGNRLSSSMVQQGVHGLRECCSRGCTVAMYSSS